MSTSKVVALLNKLAALQPKENPAIAGILAHCPELACNDWINRYGPASEWSEVADLYATPVLAWLVKVLVTAERELRWIGGSVAAPIWLFRAYQQRSDATVDALAEWIFRNKGNDYLPFGSASAARSLAEWRLEQTNAPTVARLISLVSKPKWTPRRQCCLQSTTKRSTAGGWHRHASRILNNSSNSSKRLPLKLVSN